MCPRPCHKPLVAVKIAGWDLGLAHQSNGQSDPLSRSWNRINANLAIEAGNLAVAMRTWYRIPEDPVDDDNPHRHRHRHRHRPERLSGRVGVGAIATALTVTQAPTAIILLRPVEDIPHNRPSRIAIWWVFSLDPIGKQLWNSIRRFVSQPGIHVAEERVLCSRQCVRKRANLTQRLRDDNGIVWIQ